LSSMVKMYKAQIPKKPRKCLSQRDKEVMGYLHGYLAHLHDDDKNSDDPCEEAHYSEETLKLLDRLLK